MRPFAEIFRSHAIIVDGRHTNGTDKQTNHAYGDAYESLFPARRHRDAIRFVMEVGITDGSSMLAWREIFQNAHVVGMDIEPCACERGPRLEFWLGNQRNKEECVRAATNNGAEPNRRFDLIVEDAVHSTDNTLLTLLWLWPFVKPGGLYVVEEWQNVGGDRDNIKALWPHAEFIDTQGPFGNVETLVVFRKPS